MIYKLTHKCLDCDKLIGEPALRCNICNPKFIVNTYIKGNRSSNYKDGRTLQQYYCIDCKIEISLSSGLYGSKRCICCSSIYHASRISGKNNPMFGKNHSKKTRKLMSKNHSSLKGKNNGMYGKIPSPVKKHCYKNIWMRSSWEAKFAQWCDLSGIEWLYESKTFDLGDTTYTPDFYLPEFDCYIEIKGWFRIKGQKKFRKFKRLYKNIKLFNKPILKQMSIV